MEFSKKKEIERLNKRIYELDLPLGFMKNLSAEKLVYIHVKFHNALSFKKPFAAFDKIKKVHDQVAQLMSNHQNVDKLDN